MRKTIQLGAVAALALASSFARAEAFTIKEIRIEGLQRITEGTVYNYLPVNVGDQMSGARIREATRALYATGFFRDVAISRDGNILVIAVIAALGSAWVTVTHLRPRWKARRDAKTNNADAAVQSAAVAAAD